MKTNDFGKRVRSHCSYLANTVELFFYNTPFFFYFNASLVCTTQHTLLLVFVSFLNVRMAFVKFITRIILAKMKKMFCPVVQFMR